MLQNITPAMPLPKIKEHLGQTCKNEGSFCTRHPLKEDVDGVNDLTFNLAAKHRQYLSRQTAVAFGEAVQ